MPTITAFLAILCPTIGLVIAAAAQTASPPRVEQAIMEVIRWKAFWQGGDAWPVEYRPGRAVLATVLSSPTDVVVFIPELALGVRFIATEGQSLAGAQFVPVTFPVSNDAVVNSYLKQVQDTNCVPIRRLSGAQARNDGTVVGVQRACAEATTMQYLRSDSLVTLPTFQERSGPRPAGDLSSIRPWVLRAVSEYRRETCPEVHATVPQFQDTDPWVYLLLEDGCGERALQLLVHNREGGWELGQLLIDSGKPVVARIVERVRNSSLANIH
jgi:hypothetical protein